MGRINGCITYFLSGCFRYNRKNLSKIPAKNNNLSTNRNIQPTAILVSKNIPHRTIKSLEAMFVHHRFFVPNNQFCLNDKLCQMTFGIYAACRKFINGYRKTKPGVCCSSPRYEQCCNTARCNGQYYVPL